MNKSILPKKTMVAFTIISFLLAFSPLQAMQQQQIGHIMGFIYKNDGKTPQKDAQVILQDIKDKKKEYKSNITDKNGDYQIQNVPVGDYKVFIKLHDKDYKVKRIDFMVKIMAGKTNYISFSLKKRKLLAIIILGTAVTAAAALLLTKPEEEESASPVQR